jgi:hypothetical protein
MNLVANQRPQCPVDELMPRQWSFALEFAAYDERLEVRVVITCNFDSYVVKSGLNQSFYLFRVHLSQSTRDGLGRAVYPKA